jgi:hypothetical protein
MNKQLNLQYPVVYIYSTLVYTPFYFWVHDYKKGLKTLFLDWIKATAQKDRNVD